MKQVLLLKTENEWKLILKVNVLLNEVFGDKIVYFAFLIFVRFKRLKMTSPD